MTLHFQSIQYHRNGICGAPFQAILFRDPDEGEMLGVVFDAPYHVAVFNLSKLAVGNIAFGVNSWRGDRYEPHLRTAISAYADEPPSMPQGTPAEMTSADIHRFLAQRGQVAILWHMEDVQILRPDLTDDQAWHVLETAERNHDAGIGLNWEVLDVTAEMLYPEEIENDSDTSSMNGEA